MLHIVHITFAAIAKVSKIFVNFATKYALVADKDRSM